MTLDPSEHAIQSAFVTWCKLNEKRYPGLELAFSVPNAAKRSMALAARMRKEGLRAGVPDWWLPSASWACGQDRFHGLSIEFKSGKGRLTDAQEKYVKGLREVGWRVEVCRSTEEAIKVVRSYYGD